MEQYTGDLLILRTISNPTPMTQCICSHIIVQTKTSIKGDANGLVEICDDVREKRGEERT